MVARVISEFPIMLTLGFMFGPEQSGVFKLQEVIGQLINSEFAIISF